MKPLDLITFGKLYYSDFMLAISFNFCSVYICVNFSNLLFSVFLAIVSQCIEGNILKHLTL